MAVYGYDSQNDELHRIAGGTLYANLPIGFILPSFEDVAPVGFLKLTDTLANRTVSRTTYKELFDWATAKGLIGTGKPFGVGDGSTTFVIPDGREIAFKGIGENASGASHVKSGGLAVGEFIDDRLQDHNHVAFPWYNGGGSAYPFNPPLTQGNHQDYVTSYAQNARTGATTEVKSLGCHYYIKAKNVGVPADFIKEVSKLNSYSTDEINTGTTWIDGKTIYRCTFNLNGLAPQSQNKSVSMADKNVDTLVKTYGIAYSSTGERLCFPYNTGNNQAIGIIYSSNNILHVYSNGADWSYLSNAYLIVEYTKTTD